MTQPYIDAELRLSETHECVLCGAETGLTFAAIEQQLSPSTWRYFAGYRCIDREGCARRQQPVQAPSAPPADGKEEERADWI